MVFPKDPLLTKAPPHKKGSKRVTSRKTSRKLRKKKVDNQRHSTDTRIQRSVSELQHLLPNFGIEIEATTSEQEEDALLDKTIELLLRTQSQPLENNDHYKLTSCSRDENICPNWTSDVDLTVDPYVQGFLACAEETIRFLVEDLGIERNAGVVRDLETHLQESVPDPNEEQFVLAFNGDLTSSPIYEPFLTGKHERTMI